MWYFKFRDGGGASGGEDAVFVSSVASITGVGGSGVTNRFSGVVEPQRTENIEVASGMKVDETYVTVGQEVSVGTKLFSYDTEEAQDNITQLEIEIETSEITVESTKAQITQLEKERNNASADEKLAYTTQIMTAENSIKRAEYEQKSKRAEMESLKSQIANAVVTSELQGVVKTINKNNSGSSDAMDSGMVDESSDSSSSAYMTIMATGEYRIKGTFNEQNTQQVYEGMQVIVHSRVDESITWPGTVSTIDRENATQNQSNMYYMSSDSSMTSSSSYPFYVELENSDGLMLGQHVYLEEDLGQGGDRSGMWLDDYYLIPDENGDVTPYVWAADDKDKLEKRELTLGDYDSDLMQYEILDGLASTDYIAFPSEGVEAGQPVTRNIDQMGGASSDGEIYDDGGEVYDGDGEILDDGMYLDEGGSDVYMDEGGSDIYMDEGGSDVYMDEGGSDVFMDEGGSEIFDEGGSDVYLDDSSF